MLPRSAVRRAYRKQRRPPGFIRVVQHDRPRLLRGIPDLEREVRVREIVRGLLILATSAAVLGITWAAAEGLVMLVKAFR